MAIVISESTRALWYVDLPESNWLASVEATDAGFKLTYRFRYYKDEKAWGSADKKSWYVFGGDDIDKAIEACRFIVNKMKEMHGPSLETYEILRGTGTINQFMDEFSKLPFAHSKSFATEEEAILAGVNI